MSKNHKEINFVWDICKLDEFDFHLHRIFQIKETGLHTWIEQMIWFLEAGQVPNLQTSCKEKPEFQGLYLCNQNAFELTICSSCQSSLILMPRLQKGTHFCFGSSFVIYHIERRRSLSRLFNQFLIDLILPF